MPTAPLRLGILGTARIARDFIAGVGDAADIDIVGVASRDGAKAQAFARDTGLKDSFSSYEAMLADPDIEAIYNPLPNSLHAQWSIAALAAGKHVLCEKPLAANGAEARAMFEAAKRADRHLVEAYPYRAQAQTLRLAELLAQGAVGRVQLVQASFGFPMPAAGNIRLDAALAGGALMDAGSYVVSFARMVMGRSPVRVRATARFAETGVDTALAGTLDYADGALAQIACLFTTAPHRHALIVGDDGAIQTTFLNHPPLGGAPVLLVKRGTDRAALYETIEVDGGNGFRGEAESFARLIRTGAGWTGATPAESVDIALALDALAASARSGEAVDIAD